MRAEALIHSLSDQLITNVHAIEQAVSNHRWVELGRLYVENAELGLKLVTVLIELDEEAAEFAIKESKRIYGIMPTKQGDPSAEKVNITPEGGAVGYVAPSPIQPIKGKELDNGNASNGNAKHPARTGKGPDGKDGGSPAGGVSNSN